MQGIQCQLRLLADFAVTFLSSLLTFLFFALPAVASQQRSGSDTRQPDTISESDDIRTRFDRLYTEDADCTLILDIDGSLGVITINASKGFQTPLPLLRLLSDEVVSSHLGLVDSQIERIAETASRIEDALPLAHSFIYERTGSFDDNVKQRILDTLEEYVAEGAKVVDDVLLPHQVEPLQRALLTYQVRRVGLHAVLCSESMRNALGISPAQRKKLDEVFESKGKEATQRLFDEQTTTSNELLSVLTEDQRKRLTHAIGDQLNEKPVTPTFFRLQLTSEFQEAIKTSARSKSAAECIAATQRLCFRMRYDATVHADRHAIVTSAGYVVNSVLLRGEFAQAIGLSDDQRKAAAQFQAEYFEKCNQMHALEWRAARERGGEWWPRYRKAISEKRELLDQELLVQSESILLPFQRSQLEQILFAIVFRQVGIVGGLNNAPSELLSLSSTQRRDLARKATTGLERLKELSLSEERQLNKQLLNVLSREQRDRFKELTLPELSLESGQIDFHQYFRHPSVLKKMMLQHEFLNRLIADAVAGNGNTNRH